MPPLVRLGDVFLSSRPLFPRFFVSSGALSRGRTTKSPHHRDSRGRQPRPIAAPPAAPTPTPTPSSARPARNSFSLELSSDLAMPHELLLFSQLPNSRHDQLLNILAGISGAQPQRVIERHVVYRPQRDPLQRQYAVGASQNVQTTQRATSREQLSKDMYYWKTVKELDEADFGPAAASTEHTRKEESSPNTERKGWSILFQDIPEPGQRPVNMRWVQTTDILTGDPHAHMKATMYKYALLPLYAAVEFTYHRVVMSRNTLTKAPSSCIRTPPSSFTVSFASPALINPAIVRLRACRL